MPIWSYIAQRIATAKTQQYLLMRDALEKTRKKQRYSQCVHTDFNELIKAAKDSEVKG